MSDLTYAELYQMLSDQQKTVARSAKAIMDNAIAELTALNAQLVETTGTYSAVKSNLNSALSSLQSYSIGLDVLAPVETPAP